MGMKQSLKKLSPYLWEVPKSGKMRVPSWLFLSEKLMEQVEDGAIQQVANVASLPGIYKHSLAMPDMHFGYSAKENFLARPWISHRRSCSFGL